MSDLNIIPQALSTLVIFLVVLFRWGLFTGPELLMQAGLPSLGSTCSSLCSTEIKGMHHHAFFFHGFFFFQLRSGDQAHPHACFMG